MTETTASTDTLTVESPGDLRLLHAEPRSHVVRFYRDHQEITDTSCDFLAHGARLGESIVIISAAPRLVDQEDGLSARGVDVDHLRRQRRLVLLDAEDVLGRLTEGGEPDGRRFDALVGDIVRHAVARSPVRQVRGYGEMVDLLWQAGQLRDALRLESFWHDLIARQPVTLLCAYKMGLLSSHAEVAAFEQVCDVHTHAVPFEERGRLERAVDAALIEVLGTGRAHRLRPLMDATVHRNARLGQAERTLFWIRRNLPDEHDGVLERARALFHAPK